MSHSDYLSTYRLDGYNPRLHFSVFKGETVATGTIYGLVSSNRALFVTFSTGDETVVKAGFEIVIYTSSGGYKGRTYVGFDTPPLSGLIPIRETSQGDIYIVAGDTFAVRRYVPFDTKVTSDDATFSPGHQPYTISAAPYPMVCSGGNSVGWVDDGETYRTVHTDGIKTRLIDPDSSTVPTHDWSLPTGGAFQSGSANTDESPLLELDVGSQLVQHDANDTDNGSTGTQYTHHVTHDADHPPYECILRDYGGDDTNGISWTVQIFEDVEHNLGVGREDIPDLALGFLWVDDVYSATGVQDMHRSALAGRSQIIGMGYVRRFTESGDYANGESIVFELQSPLARLGEIASYSKVMVEGATVDDWNTVKTLGFERGTDQLWMFYTTGTEAGIDKVTDASFGDARYPAHYLQRSDPVGQLRELADARQGRFVQTRYGGQVELQTHPAYRDLDDRESAVDIELTDDDVYSYEYSVDPADSIEILELQGITAGTSGNTDVYSRAPGRSPGGGKTADTVARKSPDDQDQANMWAGMVYALRNNVYINSEGEKQYVSELTLKCPGQYNVLDFAPNYYRFNYQGKRTDFSGLRFWLRRFSWEIDADTGEPVTTFVWQAETAAPPGDTYTPPNAGATLPIVEVPQQPPITVLPTTSRVPAWNRINQDPITIYADDAGGAHFAYSTTFDPASTTISWNYANNGLSGNGLWDTFDPFDWRRALSLRTTGIYANPAVKLGADWTLLQSGTSLFGASGRYGHDIQGSINRPGFFIVPTGQHTVLITFDYFQTFTLVSISGGSPDYTTNATPSNTTQISNLKIWVCPYSGGRIYACRYGAGSGQSWVYVSEDWGLTWTQGAVVNGRFAVLSPHVPYLRQDGSANVNDTSQELFLYGNLVVLFSDDAGSTWTVYQSAATGDGAWGAYFGSPVQSFTYGASRIFGNWHSSAQGVRISDDGGATVAATVKPFATSDGLIGVNGFPVNEWSILMWARGVASLSSSDIYWINDEALTVMHAAKPGSFTGYCANVQYGIDHLVEPAA